MLLHVFPRHSVLATELGMVYWTQRSRWTSKTNCDSKRCNCRKHGLECSVASTECRGNTCSNMGSKNDAINYRGITVLPVISMIVEAVIRDRIQPLIHNMQNIFPILSFSLVVSHCLLFPLMWIATLFFGCNAVRKVKSHVDHDLCITELSTE
jgi:hypothetical protein